MAELIGHVAVITGGAGGLGVAFARAFASAGADLLIVDLAEDKNAAVESELRRAYPERTIHARRVDLRNPAEIAQAFVHLDREFGRVDFVINNAGIHDVGPFRRLTLDEWRRVFAINVDAPMLVSQHALERMEQQVPSEVNGCRGKIINVGSAAAEVADPLAAAYGASKAALRYLTHNLAAGYASALISTTILYPGSVWEGMWHNLAESVAAVQGRLPAEVRQERLDATPTGRFQSAEAVAEIALFVAKSMHMSQNGRVIWTDARSVPA